MDSNTSLPALGGKMEELTELCRRFNVKRLEIFGSAATEAFGAESSDLDFIVDFGDQPPSPKILQAKALVTFSRCRAAQEAAREKNRN